MKSVRKRRKGGKITRNSISVTFTVIDDLVYDLNCIKLVEFVSTRLAEHHRDSLLRGEHPSGRDMPPLKSTSLDGTYGPRQGGGNTFFNNTGESAKAWILGDIKGTSVRAKRILKPTIMAHNGQELSWIINAWLDRGVDLQSVEGKAAHIIGAAVDEYIESNLGEDLAAPASEMRTGGHLNAISKRF